MTGHLGMLLVNIPTAQTVVIMHACVHQSPYYHFITFECLGVRIRSRLHRRDRSRMIKSLSIHKKPSCELIYVQNIPSTISSLWDQVALSRTSCHVDCPHNNNTSIQEGLEVHQEISAFKLSFQNYVNLNVNGNSRTR